MRLAVFRLVLLYGNLRWDEFGVGSGTGVYSAFHAEEI